MGIAGRIKTIVKANINEAVSLVENPEKLIRQSVRDMEENLKKIRARMVECIAGEKRLESRMNGLEAEKNRLHESAKALALEGKDEEAKKAIARRNDLGRELERFKAQYERQRKTVCDLKESLRVLESRAEEMRRKKDVLLARKTQARAKKEIHSALSGIAQGHMILDLDALDAFDRMEERIAELEAESEAVSELSREIMTGAKERAGAKTVDHPSTLEKELQAIKEEALKLQNP